MTIEEEIRKKIEDKLKQQKLPLLKRIGKGTVNLAKNIGKEAVKDLIVTPGTRIAQAGLATAGLALKRPDLVEKAYQDQNIDLGPLGKYDVAGQRSGASGVRQIAGQGLKAASWLYTPGGAKVALGQQTLKGAVKQGALAGAKVGGIYSAGESLQKPGVFHPGQFAGDVAKGVGTGALAGVVLGGTGYRVSK